MNKTIDFNFLWFKIDMSKKWIYRQFPGIIYAWVLVIVKEAFV